MGLPCGDRDENPTSSPLGAPTNDSEWTYCWNCHRHTYHPHVWSGGRTTGSRDAKTSGYHLSYPWRSSRLRSVYRDYLKNHAEALYSQNRNFPTVYRSIARCESDRCNSRHRIHVRSASFIIGAVGRSGFRVPTTWVYFNMSRCPYRSSSHSSSLSRSDGSTITWHETSETSLKKARSHLRQWHNGWHGWCFSRSMCRQWSWNLIYSHKCRSSDDPRRSCARLRNGLRNGFGPRSSRRRSGRTRATFPSRRPHGPQGPRLDNSAYHPRPQAPRQAAEAPTFRPVLTRAESAPGYLPSGPLPRTASGRPRGRSALRGLGLRGGARGPRPEARGGLRVEGRGSRSWAPRSPTEGRAANGAQGPRRLEVWRAKGSGGSCRGSGRARRAPLEHRGPPRVRDDGPARGEGASLRGGSARGAWGRGVWRAARAREGRDAQRCLGRRRAARVVTPHRRLLPPSGAAVGAGRAHVGPPSGGARGAPSRPTPLARSLGPKARPRRP